MEKSGESLEESVKWPALPFGKRVYESHLSIDCPFESWPEPVVDEDWCCSCCCFLWIFFNCDKKEGKNIISLWSRQPRDTSIIILPLQEEAQTYFGSLILEPNLDDSNAESCFFGQMLTDLETKEVAKNVKAVASSSHHAEERLWQYIVYSLFYTASDSFRRRP